MGELESIEDVEDPTRKRCGRGICLRESGHEGSCDEASFGTPKRHYLKGDDCWCGFAAGLGSSCKCSKGPSNE